MYGNVEPEAAAVPADEPEEALYDDVDEQQPVQQEADDGLYDTVEPKEEGGGGGGDESQVSGYRYSI